MSEKELKEAKAALKLAVRLGFISQEGFDALEERRKDMNKEVRRRIEESQPVYGLIHYSAPVYLQYELTRFRLDFVSMKAENYKYREISSEEKQQFYHDNPDLFTRYFGDSFSYEEVEDIIEKRIREEEYHGLIKNLLCEF